MSLYPCASIDWDLLKLCEEMFRPLLLRSLAAVLNDIYHMRPGQFVFKKKSGGNM